MMYFIELLIISIILMLSGMLMFKDNIILSLDWILFEFDYGISFNYEILLDYKSMLFMSIITLISSMICGYSFLYIEFYKNRFYFLLMLFILSMMLLVISPNMMSMLLGWDGLGFISFLLVLFYYSSDSSISGAIVTLMFNRLGDGLLLISMILMIMLSGSCKSGFILESGYWMVLILLGLSTKSAQFPFMSWLPKAMAAPTPISSLVHSSTLVTAGVYMMIRFIYLIEDSNLFNILSLFTMIFSGMMALSEYDLKKVVAYSTLSQMGLMVFGLTYGLVDLVFFHMVCHAIFKSMMFMSCGVIIHEINGWQDLRYMSYLDISLPISIMFMLGGSMSLSGFFFLTGFFSKDLIMETILCSNNSLVSLFFFYLSTLLSLLYSWRLIKILIFDSYYIPTLMGSSESMMMVFMIILFFGSICGGFMLSLIMDDFILFNSIDYWVKLMISMMILILLTNFCLNFGIWVDFYKCISIIFLLMKNLMLMDLYWLEIYGGYKINEVLKFMVFKTKDYSFFLMMMTIFVILMLI